MTIEPKLQREVIALRELASTISEDQYKLGLRVEAISTRMHLVEGSVSVLNTTVSNMAPLLETNTRVTTESAQDISAIKESMLKLEPSIDSILVMVKENQQRLIKRAIYAGWVRFWKSTAGLVVVILGAAVAIGGAFVTLGKFFFAK